MPINTNNISQVCEKKFHGIEFLRFLCSLSVVISHYKGFFGGSQRDEFHVNSEQQPFFSILQPFYMDGGFAVRIFWAISGFIFIWKYAQPIFERKISARKFFIFRFSRLYPLHLATLISITILQLIYKEGHGNYILDPRINISNFLANLLFISYNLSFNGVIWSVCIEAIIYLIFFILASRLKLSILNTCMLVFIFKYLLYFPAINQIVIQCGALFFLGGMLYYVYEYIEKLNGKYRILITIAALSVTLALWLNNFGIGSPPSSGIRAALKLYAFIPCLILSFVLIFEWDNSILTKLSHIGNYTYSSYLIHPSMMLLFILATDHFGLPREFYYGRAIFIAYAASVFIAAYFIYEYFEIYAQALIRNYFIKKKPISI